MLTKGQIEECYNRSVGSEWLLNWAGAPDMKAWLDNIDQSDIDLILYIIGDEFIHTPFDKWTRKEYLQMETLVDIRANVLDL